jgi:hypothetical protein
VTLPTAARDRGGALKVWDEESGVLHRELEGFRDPGVSALASFLSADGQQVRLVAGSYGFLRMYDPEAGSLLHHLTGHGERISDLACIASSSAAPHHPRIVSVSWDRTAKVWDGETGELLEDLRDHGGPVNSVAVWKEHTGGSEHDRIALGGAATGGHGYGVFEVKVWDGEAFTVLHHLQVGRAIRRVAAFKSAEGPHRLVVGLDGGPLQVWDPEEGRKLHDGINRAWLSEDLHLFESAQGRHLLATVSRGTRSVWNPLGTVGTPLRVWDLGEAPAGEQHHMRPAHHLG